MRTFHIPLKLNLNRRGSRETTNRYTHQMSPNFMVFVILCAQPPSFHDIICKETIPKRCD